MSAAFTTATRTRVPYRRGYRPAAKVMEVEIIDEWHALCARVDRGDQVGVRLSTTRLHDLGVHLHRARVREARQA
ncbi:hypothetical protein [Luteimonas terricola]|uniref:Uncharacterized protein n=1 Tax=Luteimonas terricola TaxID=645597 RepID=A0ABQ2EFA9_9GAMM|nr:hypothetical protein [Luteimonas terricola]GGK08744.1 hypothetical protein GCM10011394_17690 [Luteimonas terricola]